MRSLGKRPVFFPPLAKGGQGGWSWHNRFHGFMGPFSAGLIAALGSRLEAVPQVRSTPTFHRASHGALPMSDRSLGVGSKSGGSASRPIINALLVGTALLWGVSLLVRGGRLTWPPYALLNSLATLAGCMALVGPLIRIISQNRPIAGIGYIKIAAAVKGNTGRVV